MATGRRKAWLASSILLAVTAAPLAPLARAQHGHDSHGNGGHSSSSRNNGGHSNYYSGERQNMRGGDYNGRYGRDDHRDNRGGGGIGPGYGALIGAGGGAALGALFGGGLKGTLIGGAAGAGVGALGGALAQGGDDHHHDGRRH